MQVDNPQGLGFMDWGQVLSFGLDVVGKTQVAKSQAKVLQAQQAAADAQARAIQAQYAAQAQPYQPGSPAVKVTGATLAVVAVAAVAIYFLTRRKK